ncbi:MAG: hypothetical protein P1V81_18300 [Planctomycetota bacterium]|nr:hypothetical protein [Planctomycetota bacterium]
MPTPTRLLAAAGLALLVACTSTKPRDLDPIGYLEVRFVEDESSGRRDLTALEHKGAVLHYGPGQTFGLTEVGLGTDLLGRPCLHFELREKDKPDFRALTAANVGRSMAIVVGGEVVSLANLVAPLPGKGQVEGDFDLGDIEAMVQALEQGPSDD